MRGSVVVQLHRSCTSKASLVRAMNSPIGLGTWWGVGKKNIVKGHRVFSEGTVHSRTTGIPSARYRSPVHQKRYIYSNGIFSFFFFFLKKRFFDFPRNWDPLEPSFQEGFVNAFRSQFSNKFIVIFKRGFKILYILYKLHFFTFFLRGKNTMRKISRSYPISSVLEKDRYAYHRGDFCISL